MRVTTRGVPWPAASWRRSARSTASDAAITPETLAPLDHFNGRGLAATQELVALLDPHAGESLLDIGSGIGGPARWIAMQYGCTVTGVDVTAAFCEAARVLNAACGVADRVRIFEGTALALPFPDASFDRAYSHGVMMSIADKVGVYREAFRVLKPGGRRCCSSSMRDRTVRRSFRCPGRRSRRRVFSRPMRRPAATWWRPAWPWSRFVIRPRRSS